MEYLPSLQRDFDELKPSLFGKLNPQGRLVATGRQQQQQQQADCFSFPSELLSEQQLSALLPPSLRYVLAVATHRHPRYLLRILNSFDEVYALLSFIVESYYLRTFGGSFTENFYSLKRERVLLTKNGEIPRAQIGAPGPVRESLKLRRSDVWKNLAVMVVIPYLKRKLDEGYDIHAAPQASLIGGPRYNPSDDLPPNPTFRQRLDFYYKWFLRNAYPSVNAAYYFSILAFNLAYLFDSTKYPSPFLWLIGTRIRRLGAADHRAIAAILDGASRQQSTPGGNLGGGSMTRSRPGLVGMMSPQNIYPQLLSSLRYFLPASIFALKFLEWWHQSDFSRRLARKATEVLDIPAPVVSGTMPSSEQRKRPDVETKKSREPATKADVTTTTTTNKDLKSALKTPKKSERPQPPISTLSYLPIFTVSLPPVDLGDDNEDHSSSEGRCALCLGPLNNPTACQTGYVFCYVCVFRWLKGEHQRQIDFMSGEGSSAPWEEEEESDSQPKTANDQPQSREGKWESGKGRCPVTGRRVLGGTDGLRRVLV